MPPKEKKRAAYRVLVGSNYKAGKAEVRLEPGDEVDDLPENVKTVLLAINAIEEL